VSGTKCHPCLGPFSVSRYSPASHVVGIPTPPPSRLSLHVGDVGHTLVAGPTGAGKSVLLALMALQFRRYARSRVFAFDFGGSIRTCPDCIIFAVFAR
jgi:hypothetical protein